MKVSQLAIFILQVVVLAACSNHEKYGQPQSITDSNGQTVYHFATALEASYSATQFKLTCKTPGNCPENVGSLINHNQSDLSICTFSLIAEDIAISNRHCINADIARRGASCAGIVEFVLLKHGTSDTSEIFQCVQVLSVPEEYTQKDDDGPQRDFAVFKIQRSRSQSQPKGYRTDPFQVDQRGIPDGESFHVIVTDPTHDVTGAVFREQTCKSLVNPFLSSGYAVATDPAITFNDCTIVHGNSGSPVLDSTNKLRAIINQFPKNDPPDQEQIAGAANGNAFDTRIIHTHEYELKMHVGYGTNLACVDIPELNMRIPSIGACTPTLHKITIDSVSSFNSPEFENKNRGRLKAWVTKANEASPVFDWEWTQPPDAEWGQTMQEHRLVRELSPFCFKGIYDKFTWQNSVAPPDANGLSSYKISLNADLIDEDVDQSLKFFPVYSTKVQKILIKFNLNELLQSDEHVTHATIERSGFILAKSNVTTQKIGFCLHYVKKD